MSTEEKLAYALDPLPEPFAEKMRYAHGQAGGMADAMLQRDDMPPTRALMAGLALDPTGRIFIEDAIVQYAQPFGLLPGEAAEVIVGGGAHAAIYAATRRRMGYPRPLVLEKSARFGGTFAMTQESSFFLNSRNRPGPLGAPGSRDALNVIAGALMQPSDLSGREYQANADVGLVVRCSLMLHSTVRQAEVQEIVRNGNQWLVITDRGAVRAKRVIVATGLGERSKFRSFPYDGQRVLSFEQFMQRMASMTFPLQGLGRVAVVGAGDSGRTAIESLTGYGPTSGGSVASLDYVESIGWYGVGEMMTRERWLECNRTRYKPLAVLFKSSNKMVLNARVRSFGKANVALRTPDSVQLNAESYDTVIGCFGFRKDIAQGVRIEEGTRESLQQLTSRSGGGIPLARANDDRSLVVVGPAAKLPLDKGDNPSLPEENLVALFRLAPRTEATAMLLPPA